LRALLQRVTEAQVEVAEEIIGQTGPGLLIFVCAMRGDEVANADALATKVAKLRVFKDTEGRTNRSILDSGGSALVISQFTLAADTSRGNRPGFSAAADPDLGERLYERFASSLAAEGVRVESGRFGAEMRVSLVNDGPMTILLER
jgi:D-tyrosyl-tRNA(Tyr) deacylase